MKNIMINGSKNQLELGLDDTTRAINCALRRRHTVASRWFRRMHQVVDSAREYRPALPSRRPVGAITTVASPTLSTYQPINLSTDTQLAA